MHRVVLSLGSNIGNREENLRKALYLLGHRGIRILKASRIIKSAPWGNWDQPDFLNMAVMAETSLPPENLLKTIKEIEKDMGRITGHMKPRIIDIDIILFGNLVLKTDKLEIPHPSYKERGFVLAPLIEIAPTLKDPITKQTMSELYSEYLQLPFVGSIRTPIGDFFVSVKNETVIATSFQKIRGRMEYTTFLGKILKKLQKYFEGKPVKFNEFKLQLSLLPPAYRRIYDVLRKLPYGVVISYSEIAELSGIHGGARVVGNAMKKNPIPIIIPCHRVIRSDGSIGNYSAGIDKKIFLLKLELKDNFFNVFPECAHQSSNNNLIKLTTAHTLEFF